MKLKFLRFFFYFFHISISSDLISWLLDLDPDPGGGNSMQIPEQRIILHCKEISIYVFPEKELRGLSPHFQIHVSERFTYSHDRSTNFAAAA